MRSSGMSEHKMGPFAWDEAIECIQKFARALTNLKLNSRFSIDPVPQPLGHNFYQIVLLDRQPDKPKPEGLTTLHIRAAENAESARPKTKYYDAFGQRMSLNKWAQVTGVSWPTLKARIDAGMTMEEAITEIALKNAPLRKSA